MNNRLLTLAKAPRATRSTARRHVAAMLAQEILDNPSTKAFLMESEHQLCRRFNVSRGTMRLILDDLKNRGLIYRKQGKGTFAHGCSARIYRHMGVLIKSPLTTENRPLAEILRGAQTFMAPLGASIILISMSPEEWSSELASALAGVIVVPEGVTEKDLGSLTNRRLPFFIVGETDLPGFPIILDSEEVANSSEPTITGIGNYFFTAGHLAAEALTQAFLTGISASDIAVRSIPYRELRFNFGT